MSNKFLICKICGEKLRIGHLKKHNISSEEYYLKFINNKKGECVVCNKLTVFLGFQVGFKKCCSRECLRVNMSKLSKINIKKTLNKHPNLCSKAGKIGGLVSGKLYKKEQSERMTKRNKEGLAVIAARASFKKLNNFKKEHFGMTKSEWLLWNNKEFKKLNPILQDTRFWECLGYRWGTKGIVMDFSLPNSKLCVEIDGSWHDKPGERNKDQQRDKWLLETHGWKTLRFRNEEIENNIENVILKIKEESCLFPC